MRARTPSDRIFNFIQSILIFMFKCSENVLLCTANISITLAVKEMICSGNTVYVLVYLDCLICHYAVWNICV